MVDGLNGLGHHVVVGCDDDNTQVGDLGSAGTHGGKRFVTGCVKECNASAVAELDIVGSDVLGYTSGLACNHVGVADVVEQRGFTVVNVSHYGDNRRTGGKVVLIILFLMYGFNHFG